jgi:rod shape-determining protein MreC
MMKLPQPETSTSRQYAILIVLVVLAVLLTTMWFREGDRGLVHRLRGGVQTVASPVGAFGEVVTRPVRNVFRWTSELGVSRSQLEALRTQNDELRSRVASLEEARLQNERLQALVGFVQTSKLQAVGARVIGRPTDSWEGVITIDRGSADGVRESMPVLGASGLLGQTVSVTQHSARVRLLTDPNSGVAAMVQASRAEGLARGSISGELSLDFVSREATVKAGDVVITSGMGGIYPKGLLVGEITKVTNNPTALYQDIEVRPSTALGDIEEVVVLVGAAPAAQIGGGE